MTTETLKSILANIKIFDRKFSIYNIWQGPPPDNRCGWHLQVSYFEPDIDTGKMVLQKSRMWQIPEDATETDVVRTAYAAVTRSYAHVVSEHFTYKGKRVFGPHIKIDALLAACDALDG